jgi:hypothetical protein
VKLVPSGGWGNPGGGAIMLLNALPGSRGVSISLADMKLLCALLVRHTNSKINVQFFKDLFTMSNNNIVIFKQESSVLFSVVLSY